MLSYIQSLLGATRKGSLYGRRRSPASQIGPGLLVCMQIEDPRPRCSRATKVHAENLTSQARRSAWQRAQPGPLLGHGCIVCRYPPPSLTNSTCIALPRRTGIRRIGGRDNHWSIKSVGRTRPQNILLMEPVSNPSCLVWQLGRGRPPGLSLVNQTIPTEQNERSAR